MWVLTQWGDSLYAYKLEDGTRDSEKDISLGSLHGANWSMVYDGSSLLISQADRSSYRLRAIDMPSGTYNAGKSMTPQPNQSDLNPTGYIGYSGGNVLSVFLNSQKVWLAHANGRYYAHQRSDAAYLREDNISGLPGEDSYRSVHMEDDKMWVIGKHWDSGSNVQVMPLVGPLEMLNADYRPQTKENN